MERLDIGIDLGTSTVLVYLRGKGVVLEEPSVIAVNTNTGEVLAVGSEAHKMIGRTPDNIRAVRPMRDGVISDYDATNAMIQYFIHKVCKRMLLKPRVAICIPSGITPVESKAVIEAAMNAGVRKVYLIEEPVAAAIGAGIDISKPNGVMIVDIGGGTTDVAVISLSGIAASDSIKIAGNRFDEAISHYILSQHGVFIGERMSEQIKMNIGNVFHRAEDASMEIKGRDRVTGLPAKVIITRKELLPCLLEVAEEIITAVKRVLEKTPPELAGDIKRNGIVITGGGGLIGGLCELLTERTGIPAEHAPDPVQCVATGTGTCFEFISSIQDGIYSPSTYNNMVGK